jgi:hypothetical protein
MRLNVLIGLVLFLLGSILVSIDPWNDTSYASSRPESSHLAVSVAVKRVLKVAQFTSLRSHLPRPESHACPPPAG